VHLYLLLFDGCVGIVLCYCAMWQWFCWQLVYAPVLFDGMRVQWERSHAVPQLASSQPLLLLICVPFRYLSLSAARRSPRNRTHKSNPPSSTKTGGGASA
jgi:hypothetical protein